MPELTPLEQKLLDLNQKIHELYVKYQGTKDQETEEALCLLYLDRAEVFCDLQLWELCWFDFERAAFINPEISIKKPAVFSLFHEILSRTLPASVYLPTSDQSLCLCYEQ